MYARRLGILLPALELRGTLNEAQSQRSGLESALSRAMLNDFFVRLSRLRRLTVAVFYLEPRLEEGIAVPEPFRLEKQTAAAWGERFQEALARMLTTGTPAEEASPGRSACVLKAVCPDLPLPYIKRAFVKLKHHDVVLAPTFDGGIYLAGATGSSLDLFADLAPEDRVFGAVLRRVEARGLSCAVLPPWHDASASGTFFEDMVAARRIERKDRLFASERVLEAMKRH